MYLIWKWSTIMCALQLVVGEWIYQFFGIQAALGVAGIATGTVAVLYGAIYHTTEDFEYLVRYLSAFMAMVAVVGWGSSVFPTHDFVLVAVMCTLLIPCLSATIAERVQDQTKESTPLILLAATALPLGVGMFVGAPILLRRFYHKYELVSKRQFIEDMKAQ
ncbi:MAG: hypothetical protein RLZZ26_330 [Candidatus Parcubacteria bacterium]|jgi:uncharacterized protein YceK